MRFGGADHTGERKVLAYSNYQRPNSRAQEAWLREITKTREKFSDFQT